MVQPIFVVFVLGLLVQPANSALFLGDDNANTFEGTDYDDTMKTYGGHDFFLVAHGGNDEIFSGDGNEAHIWGGDGDDYIYTGDGADVDIRGEFYDGETGNDVIKTGDGNDRSVGGSRGNDIIYAGDGDDTNIEGDEGNDTVAGGFGDDEVLGNAGYDVIIGGPGNDVLEGGTGPDTFVFGSNDGADVVEDMSSKDKFLIPANAKIYFNEQWGDPSTIKLYIDNTSVHFVNGFWGTNFENFVERLPSASPTYHLTQLPTHQPTQHPTHQPTQLPTHAPSTRYPTCVHTASPVATTDVGINVVPTGQSGNDISQSDTLLIVGGCIGAFGFVGVVASLLAPKLSRHTVKLDEATERDENVV